jgi:hypothetical protein
MRGLRFSPLDLQVVRALAVRLLLALLAVVVAVVRADHMAQEPLVQSERLLAGLMVDHRMAELYLAGPVQAQSVVLAHNGVRHAALVGAALLTMAALRPVVQAAHMAAVVPVDMPYLEQTEVVVLAQRA